jgi:hypothetical protein
MTKTILSLLFLTASLGSGTALAIENCKLLVLNTGVPNGGLTWTYLRYSNFSLEQCQQLCKDEEALRLEINPYALIMNCKMKYIHEDGTITKAKYTFSHWPF